MIAIVSKRHYSKVILLIYSYIGIKIFIQYSAFCIEYFYLICTCDT